MHEGTHRDAPELGAEELLRYGRHLTLPQVGLEGQRKLKAARVLLVGAGGLGSPAALYLAAAGVGTITIVDDDVVDASNLQRQILHGSRDIGRPKTESARERLADLNPNVRVDVHATRLTAANARALVAGHDVVLDGSDNFATRYLVNDACVLEDTPDVYASVFRFEGQASVLATPDGPCYRCIFPDPPPRELVPDCAEAGVLGVLPGLLGVIQATEALKLILGVGQPLVGRLLMVDALGMQMRTIEIPRNPECPACGRRSITRLTADGAASARPPRQQPSSAAAVPEVTPRELAAELEAGDPLVLLDVREPAEWQVARLPGARLVPLGTLEEVLPTLDLRQETVVYCRSGVRSATAVRRLRAAGFEHVRNLAGGILRWSEDVDPKVPRY
ncbi:MAG TPA: molybdopterin-synthase adenylyltransferase MoeB [Gemmatimonadaceae bacterium]|nr:molybdopterin-synthase adenylyltransferase MoeB [Gemmatimonadaceae bacterium]